PAPPPLRRERRVRRPAPGFVPPDRLPAGGRLVHRPRRQPQDRPRRLPRPRPVPVSRYLSAQLAEERSAVAFVDGERGAGPPPRLRFARPGRAAAMRTAHTPRPRPRSGGHP